LEYESAKVVFDPLYSSYTQVAVIEDDDVDPKYIDGDPPKIKYTSFTYP
jgi:hypothetical protein